MFGFSAGEILLIAFIALILFGNDKLPENMKKLFKGLNQAKKVASDVQKSWYEIQVDVQRSLNFEEEKKELLELTKPIVIDPSGNVSESVSHSIQDPLEPTVPQEEIDEYQNTLHSLSEQASNDLLPSDVKLTPEEHLNSSHFVGPKI